MADEIEHHRATDNIFADLGFDDPELEMNRADLAHRIDDVIRESGLSVKVAAGMLGIDEAELSLILSGDLGEYNLDQLMRLLTRIGQDVKIVVVPASNGQSTGRIEVERSLISVGQSAVRPPST